MFRAIASTPGRPFTWCLPYGISSRGTLFEGGGSLDGQSIGKHCQSLELSASKNHEEKNENFRLYSHSSCPARLVCASLCPVCQTGRRGQVPPKCTVCDGP